MRYVGRRDWFLFWKRKGHLPFPPTPIPSSHTRGKQATCVFWDITLLIEGRPLQGPWTNVWFPLTDTKVGFLRREIGWLRFALMMVLFKFRHAVILQLFSHWECLITSEAPISTVPPRTLVWIVWSVLLVLFRFLLKPKPILKECLFCWDSNSGPCMLGKQSTTQLHPQLFVLFWFFLFPTLICYSQKLHR